MVQTEVDMLSEKIKELRMSMNISQVKLGEELGVSKQCVSNWENDNIQPSIDMLVKLAGFFHVSCDYLLGLDFERVIDVSKLTDEQIAHIILLVKDLSDK